MRIRIGTTTTEVIATTEIVGTTTTTTEVIATTEIVVVGTTTITEVLATAEIVGTITTTIIEVVGTTTTDAIGLKTGFSHFTTHINMIEQLQYQQYIAFVIDG